MCKRAASWLKRTALIVGLVSVPFAANAITCPDDDACNGNSYTATVTSVGADTWQIKVDVNVLASYDGTLNSDLLSALGIKNMAGTITNTSLYSYPSGGDAFAFYAGELNNGGDVCALDNEPGTKMCAWAGDGKGVDFNAGDTLSFVFQFDAVSLVEPPVVHIKYQYLEWVEGKNGKPGEYKKTGSLGSFDLPLQTCTNGDCDPDPCTNGNCNPVPAPASIALLGAGLLGIGAMRRWTQRR